MKNGESPFNVIAFKTESWTPDAVQVLRDKRIKKLGEYWKISDVLQGGDNPEATSSAKATHTIKLDLYAWCEDHIDGSPIDCVMWRDDDEAATEPWRGHPCRWDDGAQPRECSIRYNYEDDLEAKKQQRVDRERKALGVIAQNSTSGQGEESFEAEEAEGREEEEEAEEEGGGRYGKGKGEGRGEGEGEGEGKRAGGGENEEEGAEEAPNPGV